MRRVPLAPCLAATTFAKYGQPLHSWRTLITPYLAAVDQLYQWDEPWDGPKTVCCKVFLRPPSGSIAARFYAPSVRCRDRRLPSVTDFAVNKKTASLLACGCCLHRDAGDFVRENEFAKRAGQNPMPIEIPLRPYP
ncbi:hypothetical protein Pla52n_07620 [Stieleria varia]|uniref:Uncharacterized protein n=1 Tax=Stieleria varia TaxID=2528005 RepID=A0A5C6B898_9BACT|nr:hypothetical protein Pla52n_07620 [Stieleria varia]